MKTICTCILLGLLWLLPDSVQAQLIRYSSASIAGHWYAPDLEYYADSDVYLVDFGASYVTEVQLEFELLRVAILRGSLGHWQKRSAADVGLSDPPNARRHEATLRIVPISGSLLLAPSFGRGPRPVVGGGVSRNLIQRSLTRTRLSGTTASESFSGNGRDFSYHVILGVHVPVAGRVWAGLESRYVWGSFEEEQSLAGTERANVSVTGPQMGISIRYHIQ